MNRLTSIRETRVVLADDHPIISMAVRDALHAIPGVRVLAAVASGSELLDTLRKTPCDLVVTDFSMFANERGEDGLQLIQHLRRLYPRTPVVVFTMIRNLGVLHQLSRLGVAAIVGKDEQTDVLCQYCLSALDSKETLLSPGTRARLASDGMTVGEFLTSKQLSPKELEVVRLFAHGLPITEIARRLNRTLGTVGTQKRAAMRKLHVETNVDLIRYLTEHGLL
jgi:two-component system, NarL family, captular synthesis response regulator RcsB